ncbi:hypothetical protein ACO34A_13080 [Rhizobium sp. ACO-34A]|nr:hypothetical protein [Rhizobium sp. ACO-34A]ATN34733.1 hypothetical protein ACO34A_13080 [Rhizobium sp. ACO-34A]
MTAYTDPLFKLEDTLIDLRALVTLALFAVEHADDETFAAQKSTFCTTLYLMQEKLAACDATHKDMWLADCDAYQAEARH